MLDTGNTDDLNERIDTDVTGPKNDKTMFTLINCNARSLCPKLDSLVDCMGETEATIGVVTETWLDEENQRIREELSAMHGLGFVARNREGRVANGVKY